MVELLGDVVRKLQMLPLIVPHRHQSGMIGMNIRRHQVRIHVQTRRNRLPILARLVLELGHPVEPAERREAAEHPGQLGMGRDRGLMKQNMPVRIDARRQQNRRHHPCLLPQLSRVLKIGDRMLINDAINAVAVLLQLHPVARSPEIVAERWKPRRSHSGENTCHGGLVARISGPVNRRKALRRRESKRLLF